MLIFELSFIISFYQDMRKKDAPISLFIFFPMSSKNPKHPTSPERNSPSWAPEFLRDAGFSSGTASAAGGAFAAAALGAGVFLGGAGRSGGSRRGAKGGNLDATLRMQKMTQNGVDQPKNS